MERDEAIKLLRGGSDGIAEWNKRRKAGEEIPALYGENLNNADLRSADLSGAMLRGANLEGAHLNNADLRSADLTVAYLREADLREADLRDANLCRTTLDGANLHHTNLHGANMSTVFPSELRQLPPDKQQELVLADVVDRALIVQERQLAFEIKICDELYKLRKTALVRTLLLSLAVALLAAHAII